MNSRIEVENYVHNHWIDHTVAQWVISQFELLKLAYSAPPCPIYSLSLTQGLQLENSQDTTVDLTQKQKLITSGGFEGVRGHIQLIKDLHEIRALTSPFPSRTNIMLLLEPDSYIKTKGRDPIVTLEQRMQLWATSGLIDAVVLLPEGYDSFDKSRYDAIHDILSPALWCTSVENPHFYEIIMRGNQQEIDIIRIVKHHPELHTSFLSKTRTMTAVELPSELHVYLFDLTQNPKTYILPAALTPKQISTILLERLLDGFGK